MRVPANRERIRGNALFTPVDLCGVTVSPREGREDWNGVIDAEYNEIKGFDRRSAGNSGGVVTSKHFLSDHGRDDDGSVLCEKSV